MRGAIELHGATVDEPGGGSYSSKVVGLIGGPPPGFRRIPPRPARRDAGGMKTHIAVASIFGGYLATAALQEGPIQCWLVALAPLVLLAIGFVLHVGDAHKTSR
jgi:hypothetical protein